MAFNDHELITYARQGDVNAFEQLVHRYDKQVFSIASRYVSCSDDAKDIYQEVFLRVYKGLKNFRMQSEFSTWLYRVTTNVCLTHQTQRKKRNSSVVGHNEDFETDTMNTIQTYVVSPDEQAHASEISSRVEFALGVLSPQQKLVFTLKHYQGYKLREIASMMKCTEGTVKRYLFTATQRLRGELRELIEE